LYGVSVDEAAKHDAEIPDFDWSVVPAGVQRGWFDVPSGRLAALLAGEPGEPRVVLVPGVTGSKEDFSLMMPLLADAGYRVESYDLAGQYESANAGPENLSPPSPRYDLDLFVNDLIAVLERGRTPAHVLGYSFAATVAQLAALRRPDLVASLTLQSPPPETGQTFRGVKRIGWISNLVNGRVGGALMIWGIQQNYTKVPPGRHAFVVSRFRLTRRSSVGDVIGLMMRTPDTSEQLAAMPIPKLVAVGEHDVWPTSLHRAFAESIGARFKQYATGHSPCEEAPHQLVRDMLALYAERRA
jgi:pimeloyl-ACP methyl ester carboxylesterase